jgi:hypothetical protein
LQPHDPRIGQRAGGPRGVDRRADRVGVGVAVRERPRWHRRPRLRDAQVGQPVEHRLAIEAEPIGDLEQEPPRLVGDDDAVRRLEGGDVGRRRRRTGLDRGRRGDRRSQALQAFVHWPRLPATA